jgi:ribose 5-phosphate isomerase RpiB
LDIRHKRRRRNCSEFSGSEISLSKFSGYESDSSFSDMSSLHGAETIEAKDVEIIKIEKKESFETAEEFPENVQNPQIKRRLSNDAETNGSTIDTNSNLCLNKDTNLMNAPVKDEADATENAVINNSTEKVPEKSIILDIMKQTFNDTFEEKEDKEKRLSKARNVKQKVGTVSTTSFYNRSASMKNEKDGEAAPREESPAPV